MNAAPRTVTDWRELYRTRGPGPTAEAWLLRLAAVSPAVQRAALCGLPDTRTLTRRFEVAWESRDRPLAGVPYLAKDLFAERGARIGAGSTFLADRLAPADKDASLLAAFRDDAGAVLCGKTQLNEFAFGLSGENPHFGDCPHPRRADRLSGGSSSGSAWAVGAGLVPSALATDTVGSIRIPADVLEALRREALRQGATKDRDAAAWLLEQLRGNAEAYPVLGGHAAAQVHARWMESHGGDYDPVVLARLIAGRNRNEAELASASKVRDRVTAAFRELFASGWDAVALPCTAGTALPKVAHDARLRARLLALNAPASLAGLGALALPVATGDEGLTAGLQLVARDADVLRTLVGNAAANS